MTAAYRLKGIGWLGGTLAVALTFYLVSLQVAAERKKLDTLDAKIAGEQRDIRALETEFETRANLAQLERWNGDTLALSAPSAAQFVRDEDQLASIDPRQPIGAALPGQPQVKMAALIVPSLPTSAAQPAPAPIETAPPPAPKPVTQAIAVQTAAMTAKAPVRVAAAVRVKAPAAERPTLRLASLLRPKREVAMLDRHLLSDSTLGDLMSRAHAEAKKR